MFESFVVSLMKKASKDKRYGVIRNGDSTKHENPASSPGQLIYPMGETYPPTLIREQPTLPSHDPKKGDLSPQSRSSNFKICC